MLACGGYGVSQIAAIGLQVWVEWVSVPGSTRTAGLVKALHGQDDSFSEAHWLRGATMLGDWVQRTTLGGVWSP